VIQVDHPLNAGRELVALVIRALELSDWPSVRVIPPGGSSPRGILGCVGAGLELAAQVKDNLCPEPKKIYVALGTGGTAVGLALGLALGGLGTETVAVTVASKFTGNEVFLRLLARRCLTYLAGVGQPVDFPRLRLKVAPSFIGSGYARPTAQAKEAVELAAGAGIALETTYTGKTFAALLADIRSGKESGPVMLLNTYGTIDHVQRPPLNITEDSS
jgi:D-cysteine desulfhydrase